MHEYSEGTFKLEGQEVNFKNPREALNAGIAAVYQDLAMVPPVGVAELLPRFRANQGRLALEWIDKAEAKRIAKEEMAKMELDIRDTEQPVGTLSGGERQSVAIARRSTSAKVLILDEPTSALGVKQSGVVLRYVVEAARRGLGVIFITHNPNRVTRSAIGS